MPGREEGALIGPADKSMQIVDDVLRNSVQRNPVPRRQVATYQFRNFKKKNKKKKFTRFA